MGRVGFIQQGVEFKILRQFGAGLVQGILIRDERHVFSRELHRSQFRPGFVLHLRAEVVAVFGHSIRPDLLVTGEHLRPLEPGHPCFQPVNLTIVHIRRFPGGVEVEPPGRRLAVPIGVNTVKGLYGVRIEVIPGVWVRRKQSLTQIHLDVRCYRLLDDIHNFISEMLPRLPIRV